MSDIIFSCTNRSCNYELSFDAGEAGSMAFCPNCGQKLIVPEPVANVQQQVVPKTPPAATPSQPPLRVRQREEGDYQRRTRRKVKMGAGCLAMMAVLFTFFILALGYNTIVGITDTTGGLITIGAGIGGIGAFFYFGYWATETEDDTRDRYAN